MGNIKRKLIFCVKMYRVLRSKVCGTEEETEESRAFYSHSGSVTSKLIIVEVCCLQLRSIWRTYSKLPQSCLSVHHPSYDDTWHMTHDPAWLVHDTTLLSRSLWSVEGHDRLALIISCELFTIVMWSCYIVCITKNLISMQVSLNDQRKLRGQFSCK